jgi:lactoylglutathione lyase
MKFGYTIIYVSDVPTTATFYKNAFGLETSFMHDSQQYAELDTGEVKLAFASEALAEMNKLTLRKNSLKNDTAGFEIGLICDDVQQSYQQALTAGCESICKPCVKPWGQTVAYVRDTNGILVELCTAI